MKLKNDGSENTITETKNDSIKSQCEDITIKNEFYVYALIDPEDNLPFYIGKGKNARDISHIRETQKGIIPHGNKHLFYTIKQILESGKSVIVERWDTHLGEVDALEKEVEYIKKYGRGDLKTGILANLTDGGEGQSGWVPDKSYRKRMSKLKSGKNNGMYGKKQTEDTRNKIGNANRGIKWSLEAREKLSRSSIGRKNSFYGKHHSNDTKQQIRENVKKYIKYGKDNQGYINLDHIKDDIINIYLTTQNFSETTRYVNSRGRKCSRTAIKNRLKEWNIT